MDTLCDNKNTAVVRLLNYVTVLFLYHHSVSNLINPIALANKKPPSFPHNHTWVQIMLASAPTPLVIKESRTNWGT